MKNVLFKPKSVKLSLITPVICLFTDSPVEKMFLLLNQLIFIDSLVEHIFTV